MMPLRAGRLGLATAPTPPTRKGIFEVKLSHSLAATSTVFDEPNLVSVAGGGIGGVRWVG
jgi:hypothetical protein